MFVVLADVALCASLTDNVDALPKETPLQRAQANGSCAPVAGDRIELCLCEQTVHEPLTCKTFEGQMLLKFILN